MVHKNVPLDQGRLTPHHGWEINPPPHIWHGKAHFTFFRPNMKQWRHFGKTLGVDPSPSSLSLHLRSRPPPPAGYGAEPQPKSNLVHFGFKIWHLVVTILMISGHITVKIYMKKWIAKPWGFRDPSLPPPKWRPWQEGTILLFGPVWFGCGSPEAAP